VQQWSPSNQPYVRASYRSPQPQRRRFFARLTSFDLQCPECGEVDVVRHTPPWWRRKKTFDGWRHRWRCRACRRVFAVGLAIWPVSRAPSPRGHRPFDTIPTRSELHGLRLAYNRGPDDPTNIACDCFGTDTSECALHGEDWG